MFTWDEFVRDHLTTDPAMQRNSLDYLAARFAGRPVRTSC